MEAPLKQFNFRLSLTLLVALGIVVACGGSQAPAEAPSEPSTQPAAEPTPSEAVDAGSPEHEHTMPDGSTMPGHKH